MVLFLDEHKAIIHQNFPYLLHSLLMTEIHLNLPPFFKHSSAIFIFVYWSLYVSLLLDQSYGPISSLKSSCWSAARLEQRINNGGVSCNVHQFFVLCVESFLKGQEVYLLAKSRTTEQFFPQADTFTLTDCIKRLQDKNAKSVGLPHPMFSVQIEGKVT